VVPRAGRWLALLLPLSVAGLASADETLLACRKVEAADARLACYDRVVDRAREEITPEAPAEEPRAPSSAAPSSAKPKVDDADATLRERLFGRPAEESAQALRRTYGAEPPKQISSTAAAVSRTGARLFEVTLENGQVWRQEDYGDFILKPGDAIEIEAGALGSYHLQRNGKGRTVRVQRVR
jgi:hypothetical protein